MGGEAGERDVEARSPPLSLLYTSEVILKWKPKSRNEEEELHLSRDLLSW